MLLKAGLFTCMCVISVKPLRDNFRPASSVFQLEKIVKKNPKTNHFSWFDMLQLLLTRTDYLTNKVNISGRALDCPLKGYSGILEQGCKTLLSVQSIFSLRRFRSHLPLKRETAQPTCMDAGLNIAADRCTCSQ